MPRRICECGQPGPVGQPCPNPRCGRSRRRPNLGQQAQHPRSHAERKRRKAAVADWVTAHGFICPGFGRPPHEARDLTADHVLPQSLGGADGPLTVLRRGCNTRRGGRNRLGRPE